MAKIVWELALNWINFPLSRIWDLNLDPILSVRPISLYRSSIHVQWHPYDCVLTAFAPVLGQRSPACWSTCCSIIEIASSDTIVTDFDVSVNFNLYWTMKTPSVVFRLADASVSTAATTFGLNFVLDNSFYELVLKWISSGWVVQTLAEMKSLNVQIFVREEQNVHSCENSNCLLPVTTWKRKIKQ